MSIDARSRKYGQVFGDWQIGKKLGSDADGKSAVFELYRDSRGQRERSALKVINIAYTPTQEPTQEYQNTVRTRSGQAEQLNRRIGQLRDKTNIEKYWEHKFLQWRDDTGIGMDLVIHTQLLTDLRSVMKTGQYFSPKQILKLGTDICRALTVCHEQNIQHRDIRPENIYFGEDGNFILGNLGICQMTGQASGAYAAPELINGQPDQRADIYSLGLVLYELCNGYQLPFVQTGSVTAREIQMRLAGMALPAPSGQTDPRLSGIILKACAHNAADRHQTARELLANLSGSAAVQPPASAPSTVPAPKKKGVLGWVIAGAALLVACTVAIVFAVHEHSWTEATCTQAAKCRICLKKDGVAPGHSWKAADCVTAKTCQVCQETEGTPLGHQWADATYRLPSTCKVCRETNGLCRRDEILTQVAQYKAQKQYRQAIQVLDQAWRTYQEQELYDMAVDCRREFGTYSTAYVAAGKFNSLLIAQDGKVSVFGENENGEYDATDWENIVGVSAGDTFCIGLRADGTVATAGSNRYNQYENVKQWRNVVAISAGDFHTVGLLADGTVVSSAGYNHCGQAEVWNLMEAAGDKQIVAISAGYDHTLALLEDGTVVACGDRPADKANEANGVCNVSHWTGIAAICSGTEFCAGLRADGTVVVAGAALAVSDWQDVVSLSAGDFFLIGVRSDGSVLIAIQEEEYSSNYEAVLALEKIRDSWQNIVFVAAGHDHAIGIQADGRIVCAGSYKKGQCALEGSYVAF